MFLDANVFIDAYISAGKHGEASNRLLRRIISGEQTAATSPMVMDEVFYVILGKKGMEIAERSWNHMLHMRNLSILPVDQKVASLVLPFVKEGLDPRDAFHAATMRASSIDVICSYDKAFDKIKGIARQEPK